MATKAIETKYNGYRFRSRLEARWAVFFDNMGIHYDYEKEGYEIDIYGHTQRYLPDFYLPQYDVLVEVKGDWSSVTDAFLEMLLVAVDFKGQLPTVRRDMDKKKADGNGIILLGDIPNGDLQIPVFPRLWNFKGVAVSEAYFGNNTLVMDSNIERVIWPADLRETIRIMMLRSLDPGLYEYTAALLNKARSARFEHGESGYK